MQYNKTMDQMTQTASLLNSGRETAHRETERVNICLELT